AGGVFPLRLGWQARSSPRAKRLGIVPADMGYRVLHAPLDGALWSLRMSPVRPINLPPPWSAGWCRTGLQLMGEELPEHKRPTITFGICHVTSRRDKVREPGIGDRRCIHPEGIKRNFMDRTPAISLVAIPPGITHEKSAARYVHHGFWWS